MRPLAGDSATATGQTVPAWMPATNSAKASAETVTTGPVACLESRTGTILAAMARLAATSTQLPPFELYEDLYQRGDSSSRGSLSQLADLGRCRCLRQRLALQLMVGREHGYYERRLPVDVTLRL